MKIISINQHNEIEEYNTKDDNINNIDLINNDENKCQLIYYWNYNDKIIKCYSLIDGDESIKNIHKLPIGGISNIIDINSNKVDLYGNIYIICVSKYTNKILNFSIPEYGEFYFIMNDDEEDSQDSDDIDNDLSDNGDNNYTIDDNSEDELFNNELDDTKFNYKEEKDKVINKKKTINNTKYNNNIAKKNSNELDIDNNLY